MYREGIEITREELYRRVWIDTLRDLALEFGISDVGLRKICRRNGIPTPPQGYHLMSDGRRRKRLSVPLPPLKSTQDKIIRFETRESPQELEYLGSIQSRWDKLNVESGINVTSKQAREIDRALKAVKGPLHLREVDDRGILLVPSLDYPIRVSPGVRRQPKLDQIA